MQLLAGHGLHFVEQRRMKPHNHLIYAGAAFIRRISG
jgi:hypothetical protein